MAQLAVFTSQVIQENILFDAEAFDDIMKSKILNSKFEYPKNKNDF